MKRRWMMLLLAGVTMFAVGCGAKEKAPEKTGGEQKTEEKAEKKEEKKAEEKTGKKDAEAEPAKQKRPANAEFKFGKYMKVRVDYIDTTWELLPEKPEDMSYRIDTDEDKAIVEMACTMTNLTDRDLSPGNAISVQFKVDGKEIPTRTVYEKDGQLVGNVKVPAKKEQIVRIYAEVPKDRLPEKIGLVMNYNDAKADEEYTVADLPKIVDYTPTGTIIEDPKYGKVEIGEFKVMKDIRPKDTSGVHALQKVSEDDASFVALELNITNTTDQPIHASEFISYTAVQDGVNVLSGSMVSENAQGNSVQYDEPIEPGKTQVTYLNPEIKDADLEKPLVFRVWIFDKPYDVKR